MSFSRFDDALDGHPKVRKVGWEAFGLWCGAVIHCSKYLTDGRLDGEWLEEKVPNKGRRDKLIAALIEQRMLEPTASGHYEVHDYLNHNPSRAEVEKRRRQAAEKKRQQRESQGVSPGDNHGDW